MFYFIWKEGISQAEEFTGNLLAEETTFYKLESFLEDKSGLLFESCSVVRLAWDSQHSPGWP